MIGIIPDQQIIVANEGDAIDLTFHVSRTVDGYGEHFYTALNQAPDDGVAYNLTDVTIRVRRKDRLLIKEWLTGISPADIVCSVATFHLTDDTGFEECGAFDYEVEDTARNVTIIYGEFWVKKQVT